MHTLTGRRIPQLRDRLHREMGSFVSEKSFPIGFVLRRSLRRTWKFLQAGYSEVIDDFRACPAKVRDGCFKQLNHARVGSVLKFEDLAQDTNASIFQSGPVQKRGVRRRDSGFCACRARIGRILSYDHVQKPCGVFDRASHRAGRVPLAVERSHSGAAHQSDRRTDADQIVDRRGRPHAAASIGTDADRAEVRCNRNACAAAGASARIRRVVRVARETGQNRIDRVGQTHRKFRK